MSEALDVEEPKPSLRVRKQQRVRDTIVEAAYQLFAIKPYQEVTVGEIVERAEVSRSTFFRYFGDKQEVAFYDEQRLRDRIIDRERERRCPAPADLWEALAQLRVMVVDVYADVARAGNRQTIHQKLIDENPELYDRYVRKLLAFAQLTEEILCLRGADARTARLASQLAVACCLAARGSGESDDAQEAIIERFDELVSLHSKPG